MPELVFTETISESLKEYCNSNQIHTAFVLCDSNTRRHCLPLISDLNFVVIECPHGEASKSMEVVANIVDTLIGKHADRRSVLINLGGGMVCDLGGFTASIYKRGISFINIPTSLLAMVDASIGGKTGIDFLNFKNVLGVFNHAKAIFISSEFLGTLPEIEIKSAWAEIIKTAAIANHRLFESIENNLEIGEIIRQCALTKSEIVKTDFYDQGQRQLLNFGHTFGHAYESYQLEIGKPIAHGFAVAYGMLTELKLALFIKNITELEYQRIADQIKKYVGVEYQKDDLLEPMSKYLISDKKNTDSNISFSLPQSIGNGQYQYKVSLDQLKKWKIEGII